MYKKLLLLLIVAITTCSLNAQVKTNFNNTDKISVKGKFNTNYSTMVFELPVPDLKSAFAREKSETSDGSKVFYIAEPVKVNIDAGKLASWVEDGRYFHGKFTLISKGAKTLSINFSNFFLPIGTEMYIYNKDAEMITGVITDAENNKDKLWGSSIYKGDELNIEFKVPISEKEKLNLQITNVAYGYKDIFVSKVAGFGLSGACNINVLCPQGNNWVAERNSVVYIARSNGDALCSGSMLMNTCATNIPYILTANHCFVGDGNVSQ
jgi:lysyl endopeptidase